MELVAEVQQHGEGMVGRQLRSGEGMVGRAFEERASIVIEDYQNWAGRATTFDVIPFAAALAVPIVWHELVFGVLTFTRSEMQPFTRSERYLAELLAAQAAAMIQNANMFDEMQFALRRASVLYETSRSLIEFESLEQALESATSQAAAGMQAEMVFVNVVNVRERQLEHVLVGGVKAPETFEKASYEELWQGLSGLALREQEPVFSSKSMMPDPRESREAQQRRAAFGAGSLIVVPMVYQGELLGTMTAVNSIDGPDFTEQDVDVLTAISNQLAAAIMNARLFARMQSALRESQRRATQLEVASDVAQAATSVLNLEQLLPQAVEVIRRRFDLYYVGLFLVDEAGRWAVLRAGTGDAGEAMVRAQYRVAVGGDSLVGACIAHRAARIALDVGETAVQFDNPHLPRTRSEMALPLSSRGQVIGALTIQSVEPAAFTMDDIPVLQTMASHVAVAIDNARLFAEGQEAMAEMETVQRRYLGQAWSEFIHSAPLSGFIKSREELRPLSTDETLPEVEEAVQQGATIVQSGTEDEPESTLVVPIKFRGQPIGALGFTEKTRKRRWTPDDVALAESIAEQLALAAENLRLLDATQQAATRERLTREITDKMRRATDLDGLIQTTIREVSSALGASDTFMQLVTAEDTESEMD